MENFEPKIICFACNWCTSAGADLAGTSRMEYLPNATIVRVMCSSRVDAQHVLWAFKKGADGVFIGGCHPGDCHYIDGNYKTLRRMILLQKLLNQFGIEEPRVRLQWVCASCAEAFADAVDKITADVKA